MWIVQIRRAIWVAIRIVLPIVVCTTLLSGLRAGSYSLEHLQSGAPPIALTLLMTWLGGAILGPVFRPWLPGESLPGKGFMAGVLALISWPAVCMPLHLTPLDVTMALLIIPPASSMLTARLETADGGKDDERKYSPLLVAPIALASGIWIMARFI